MSKHLNSAHSNKGIFAATALAKVMSGDLLSDLTIKVGPPSYDPKTQTLFLPAVPTEDVPAEALTLLRAFLAHEAGERGLNTWDPSDKRWAKRPGLKALVNAFGDVRIDTLMGRKYPGAGMNLVAARERDYAEMVEANEATPFPASMGLVAVLSNRIAQGTVTLEQAIEDFPVTEKWLKGIEDLITDLPVEDEAALIARAEATYKRLKDIEAEEPPPPPSPEPEENDEDDQNDEQDKPESDAQSKGKDKGKGKNDQQENKDEALGKQNKPKQKSKDEDAPESEEDDEQDEDEGDEDGKGKPSKADKDDDAEDDDGEGESDEGDEGDESDEDKDGDAGAGDGESEDDEDSDEEGESGAGGKGNGNDSDGDEGDSQESGKGGKSEAAPDGPSNGSDHERSAAGDAPLSEDPLGWDDQQNLLDALAGAMTPETNSYGRATTFTYDDRFDRTVVMHNNTGAIAESRYMTTARALALRLRQVLTMPTRVVRRGLERGTVNERSLVRAGMGATSVFQRQLKFDSDDVAVSITTDLSASMDYQMPTVRLTAQVLVEALGSLRIPTEVLGWTTGGYGSDSNYADDLYRQEAVIHSVAKSFQQSYKDKTVRNNIGSLRVQGNTPTGDGLRFALTRLGARREARRILFVVTDGEPGIAVNGSGEIHYEYIRKLVARAAQVGIEVVGIGLLSANAEYDRTTGQYVQKPIPKDRGDVLKFRSLFPNFVPIGDVSELQKTLTVELTKLLLQTKKELRAAAVKAVQG